MPGMVGVLVAVIVSQHGLESCCNKQADELKVEHDGVWFSLSKDVQVNRYLSLCGSTHPIASGLCWILCRQERECGGSYSMFPWARPDEAPSTSPPSA